MKKTDKNGTPICEMCGTPLPASNGKGRPRIFHDQCRKLNHLLGWVDEIISNTSFAPEQATQLRRQLWQYGNAVKANGQNGADNV